MAMIHRRIRPNFGYKLKYETNNIIIFKTYILG